MTAWSSAPAGMNGEDGLADRALPRAAAGALKTSSESVVRTGAIAFVLGLFLVIAGACGDGPATVPASSATPALAPEPTPEPTATTPPSGGASIPRPTATPHPTLKPTPMPAFSLEVNQDTTWQEAFDAFTPREQDCIREAVDRDSLAVFLQLPVAGDNNPFDEPFGEYGSSVVACLDPDTARHLVISSLFVGMAYEEGITPSGGDRACLQERLSGIDVTELAANDEAASQHMVGAMMRCLPHVMIPVFLEPLGLAVEVDEEAWDCLRAWAADIDWQTLIFSEGLALFGALYAGVSACSPDVVVATLLEESGVGMDELRDEELTCLRDVVARFDWDGAFAEFVESPGALLAADGLATQCVPRLNPPTPAASDAGIGGEGLAALNQSAMLGVRSFRFAGDYILEPLIGVPGQAKVEGWHSRSPERLWVRIDSISPGGRSVEVLIVGETVYVRDPEEESWYESPAEAFGFDDGSALLQATFMMSIPRVPDTSEVQELEDVYRVRYSTPQGSVVISYDREYRTRDVLVSGTMSLSFSEYDSEAEIPEPDVAGPVPDGYFDDFWK